MNGVYREFKALNVQGLCVPARCCVPNVYTRAMQRLTAVSIVQGFNFHYDRSVVTLRYFFLVCNIIRRVAVLGKSEFFRLLAPQCLSLQPSRGFAINFFVFPHTDNDDNHSLLRAFKFVNDTDSDLLKLDF